MAKKEVGKCTPQCIAMKLLVLGILILLNEYYGWFSWGNFIGGILAIKGLLMLIFPNCACQKK